MLHTRCLRHNRAQSQSAVARKHPEVESGREFPSFFTPIGSESVGVDVWGEKWEHFHAFVCKNVQPFTYVEYSVDVGRKVSSRFALTRAL